MQPPARRRASLLAAGTTLALLMGARAGTARADAPDRAACVDAYVTAQDARKAGTLLVARHKLEVCTDAACPGMIQRDCAQWLDEVRRSLPSIVLVARDAMGHDLLDATATIDNAPVRLDGRVLALDPGKHVVRVRTKDGERREETLLLAEGEHDRSVVVVFPASAPARIATGVGAPLVGPPAAAPDASPRPVPTASWVLGGLGVASLGAFGIFAWRGASDRSSLGCDRACASGDYSSVNREFVIADVALAAGVALVGAAVVWWLVDRGTPQRTGASTFAAGAL